MKILKILFIVFVLLITLTDFSPAQQTGSFVFEGRARNYLVYLPQNYQPNMPVVLILHGYAGTPNNCANMTLMHEIADTVGFIVVYPEGSSVDGWGGWNNGYRKEFSFSTDTTSNDVGFISALIDTLDAHYDIDLTRVYSCGFSMGGEMTYRLAIELGHRFAAIASASGKLNDISGNLGDPLRPYPVLHIHGTAELFEYYGPGPGNLWSVVETLNFWIANNLCLLPADTVTLPDLDPNDGSTVEKISFTNCSGNSPIIHFKVIDGGHSWPGGTGNANQDINASVEILNFFQNYENPLTNIAYGKKVKVFPKCFPPQGDTLIVNARLSNPESHPALVQAMIKANRHAFRDTIQLFDDGQHHDLNAFDNIWGAAKWFSGLVADNYIIDLSTEDITTDMTTFIRPASAFTTIGPVALENRTPVADTLAPNDYKSFDILLRNLSVTDTAKNISAWIASKDSCVLWAKSQSTFDDIAPGAVSTSENKYGLLIHPNCNSSRQAKIDLFILSEGYFFWQDSFVIDIVVTNIEEEEQRIPNSFVLEQNYPNPFNPITKIKYDLPKSEKVKIEVFNLLGQRIETLLNKQMPSGSHEIEFTAKNLPSGVYWYRIVVDSPRESFVTYREAGEFTEVKKMILIK